VRERWKAVPGFEGHYEVSDRGRVRSLDRRVWKLHSVYGGAWHSLKGRMLRPGRCPSGHTTVALGKGNTVSIHRIVLLAFVGPCPDGMETLHLNHKPADNRLANLRYGTQSENHKMDYAAGKRKGWKNISRWKNHVKVAK